MSDKSFLHKMFNKPEVKISFANEEAARHFMIWLSEQGEQDYWTWMECREQEEDGKITAVRFDYDTKDFTIETTLGRLDKNE